MPSGCCGGGNCACQIIAEGRLTIDGSGQPSDPFIISLEAERASTSNVSFDTISAGTGYAADPWTVETRYAATSKLDHIPDVNAPTPTNGQVLAWNSATSTWVAQAPTVAPTGAVSHDLSLLGDGSPATPLGVVPNQSRYIGSSASGIGLNDGGMLAVVHHFSNAAARTASIPVPVTNMLSMLDTNPGVIYYWSGTAWTLQPNQTGWVATDEFLELSGPYTAGLPVTVLIVQVNTTTDANGVFDVLGLTDLAGRSGVLTVSLNETGAVAWKGMLFANGTKVSGTAYRLTDGSLMAGTPVTATVQAIVY